MINVTKPFLPPKEEYDQLLSEIWNRNWLTNNGPLVNQLELSLKSHLGLEHLLFVSNGTIALQVAIKALNLSGAIITTPYSYVATTSSIVWESCNPVFVDIDPHTLNIDPSKIESEIDENTCAILATHVFGNPCDVEELERIAKKHNLVVIYDAAHCFGVEIDGQSILNFGDVSAISFHATKVFHSIEGGAVVSKHSDIIKTSSLLRNFGHDGSEKFSGVGINGKNSEFHAAMGICNLKYIDEVIDKREADFKRYDHWLDQLDFEKQIIAASVKYNYCYYPIIFPNESLCIKAKKLLEENKVNTRRYFHPPLSNLDYVDNIDLPVVKEYSKRILCLPLFYDMTEAEIELVSRLVLRTVRY